ncbi:MAG: glycoside hydrolase family 13 protein [Clostridiaceae bacterium]
MERSSIYHKSEQPYAYAVGKDTLCVRLRTRAGDCERVLAHYKNLYDHTAPFHTVELAQILNDGIAALYEGEIQVPERHFKYWFELVSKTETLQYTSDGFLENVQERNCFYYPVINSDDIIAPPEWAKGGIVYQIFVDRFFNGDRTNDPAGTVLPETLPGHYTLYGGDLQGAAEHLDYVKSLGAEMVYLSPVLKSPTYHKYDVADYYAVDESLGGNGALFDFVQRAHTLGLKVILDAVFNHCSDINPLFLDVLRRGESSPYRSWFFLDSFPVTADPCNYDTFAGAVPSMPRFDTSNPEVIEYLTNAALHWTQQLNLDGWRLDVADEVSHSLWRELRRKLKQANPEILIIGEVWNHAGAWLRGDEFDTVTNYKLRGALISLAQGQVDSGAFWRAASANRMLYMTPLYPYLVNFAGTHDTIRIRTLLGSDALHLLTLAAVLTMDGIPLIYYGDELGMEGGEDPDNRRAMRWDLIDSPLAREIRALASFRAQSPILRYGSIEPVNADGRMLAFTRTLGVEQWTVVLNFGQDESAVAGTFKDVLLGEANIAESGIRVLGMRYAVVR